MGLGNNYQSFYWKQASGGDVPDGAVEAGKDKGETIYVARARHYPDVIPGKLVPSHKHCYISYAGNEVEIKNYEVLCNPDKCDLLWVSTTNANIPTGAIQGGITLDNEPLYIGRTVHEESTIVGKVHPSHGCLYFPYGRKEHSSKEYEILVCTRLVLEKKNLSK